MLMFLDLVVFAHQCDTRIRFWRMREYLGSRVLCEGPIFTMAKAHEIVRVLKLIQNGKLKLNFVWSWAFKCIVKTCVTEL